MTSKYYYVGLLGKYPIKIPIWPPAIFLYIFGNFGPRNLRSHVCSSVPQNKDRYGKTKIWEHIVQGQIAGYIFSVILLKYFNEKARKQINDNNKHLK